MAQQAQAGDPASSNAAAGRRKTKHEKALAELAFSNPGVKAAVAAHLQRGGSRGGSGAGQDGRGGARSGLFSPAHSQCIRCCLAVSKHQHGRLEGHDAADAPVAILRRGAGLNM